MNHYFVIIFCCVVGCAKPIIRPNTHDPPISAPVPEQVIEKSPEQKLADVDQLIKTLKFDREHLMSEFQAMGLKSTKDLGMNPQAQNLSRELYQVDIYLDVAQKEYKRLQSNIIRCVFEARQKARLEAAQKVIKVPILSDEGVILAVEKEHASSSAVKDIEAWHQKLDGELETRKAEREQIDKEINNRERTLIIAKEKAEHQAEEANKRAAQERSARLTEADRQAAHLAAVTEGCRKLVPVKPTDQLTPQPDLTLSQINDLSINRAVYCCPANHIFWSHYYYSLHSMFPEEVITTRSGGGYKVVPKSPISVYPYGGGWGFKPYTFDGFWCPHHSH